jgi:hypothetical protein
MLPASLRSLFLVHLLLLADATDGATKPDADNCTCTQHRTLRSPTRYGVAPDPWHSPQTDSPPSQANLGQLPGFSSFRPASIED